MGRQEWLEAANAYSKKAQEDWINSPERTKEAEATNTAAEVKKLEEFLQSPDGHTGLALLRSSQRAVYLGQDDPFCGYVQYYRLSSNGPEIETVAEGMWMAYSKNVNPPSYHPATAEIIVQAAISYKKIEPTEVVSYIVSQLDTIASQAHSKK